MRAAADVATDLKVRAAWLHFVEGLTQEQITQALDTTRLKVVRMLATARTDGTMRIEIAAKSASQVECERALIARFGLEKAIVVPNAGSTENAAALVGYAAGQWLLSEMRDGLSLAVGWGNTLNFALRGMASRQFDHASVISLTGGTTHSRAINPSAVARRIADMFGADCYQITAPIFVSGPTIREMLLAEPGLQDLLRRAARADLALISAGDLTPDSTLVREGLILEADIASLRNSGAVADILRHAVDAGGALVDHPVNRRVMAAGPDVLRAIPRVAIASGGAEKAIAIRASGARILITDEAAARAMLRPVPPVA